MIIIISLLIYNFNIKKSLTSNIIETEIKESFSNNFYSTNENPFGYRHVIKPTDTDITPKTEFLLSQEDFEKSSHINNIKFDNLNRNIECNLGGNNIIHEESVKKEEIKMVTNDRLNESINLINTDKEISVEEEKDRLIEEETCLKLKKEEKISNIIKDQILTNNLTEEEKNLIKNVINSYNELVKKKQIDTKFLISKNNYNKLYKLISLENNENNEDSHEYMIKLSDSLINGFLLNYKIHKNKHKDDKDLFKNYNIIIYYLKNVNNKYKEKPISQELSNICKNLLNKKKILLKEFLKEDIDNLFNEYTKLKDINCKI